MVVGNVAALSQKNVKRMLAYSSIAHGGFILIGIVSAGLARGTSQEAAAQALSASSTTSSRTPSRTSSRSARSSWAGSKGKESRHVRRPRRPRPSPSGGRAPVTLGILSLMGFPPTAGFFAKYAILASAVSQVAA